jgi:hypothetical protein
MNLLKEREEEFSAYQEELAPQVRLAVPATSLTCSCFAFQTVAIPRVLLSFPIFQNSPETLCRQLTSREHHAYICDFRRIPALFVLGCRPTLLVWRLLRQVSCVRHFCCAPQS